MPKIQIFDLNLKYSIWCLNIKLRHLSVTYQGFQVWVCCLYTFYMIWLGRPWTYVFLVSVSAMTRGRCVWKLKERRLERRVIGDRCDRYGRSGVRGIRSVRAKPRKLGTVWTETSTTDHRRWTPDVGISNIICSVFFSFFFLRISAPPKMKTCADHCWIPDVGVSSVANLLA